MKQGPRQLGYLPLEVIKKKIALPSKERMEKGPVVIIECEEDIPCDPCVESCNTKAIIKESLTAVPIVDYERCTGCALCVASCPGLAIFVVDNSREDKALVYIPYEMLPAPQKGDKGDALDRSGKRIGSAEVAKVRKGNRGTTILGILVEKNLAMNVRSIRIPERSNG
ncbi:MAG: 4Fe-4S binding protein [Planctomycetota bacterium]